MEAGSEGRVKGREMAGEGRERISADEERVIEGWVAGSEGAGYA